jgi:transcriptional regulator with GAF, ATPase, and Fis domain
VNGDGVDVVSRLDAVSEAIASLNGVLAERETLHEALEQVAKNALAAVSEAHAVSITVLGDPQPSTAAYTDEFVLALDAQQYSAGRGPCLEAASTGRPVRISTLEEAQQWPEFAEAAKLNGVHASLSIPLMIEAVEVGAGRQLVGSLNAYSRRASGFDPLDEKLLSLYTDVAGQAVTTAGRWRRLHDTVSQLKEALVSRADIDQAKGALRVINGGTADEAFATLVERSQRENVKLRELARQIVDELSRSLPPR